MELIPEEYRKYVNNVVDETIYHEDFVIFLKPGYKCCGHTIIRCKFIEQAIALLKLI